jgi:hypothetical protein
MPHFGYGDEVRITTDPRSQPGRTGAVPPAAGPDRAFDRALPEPVARLRPRGTGPTRARAPTRERSRRWLRFDRCCRLRAATPLADGLARSPASTGVRTEPAGERALRHHRPAIRCLRTPPSGPVRSRRRSRGGDLSDRDQSSSHLLALGPDAQRPCSPSAAAEGRLWWDWDFPSQRMGGLAPVRHCRQPQTPPPAWPRSPVPVGSGNKYEEGSHRDPTLCRHPDHRWDLPGRPQPSGRRRPLAWCDHVPRRRGDARHHASDG